MSDHPGNLRFCTSFRGIPLKRDGGNLLVGEKGGKISLLIAADEIHVDIYSRNSNKPAAENEQFFGIKIPSISPLYRHLKKEKKSWGGEKGNKCLFHPPDYENNAAAHHKTDEVGVLYQSQHVDGGKDIIEPGEIQVSYGGYNV